MIANVRKPPLLRFGWDCNALLLAGDLPPPLFCRFLVIVLIYHVMHAALKIPPARAAVPMKVPAAMSLSIIFSLSVGM